VEHALDAEIAGYDEEQHIHLHGSINGSSRYSSSSPS
jgi:hypothetical protein